MATNKERIISHNTRLETISAQLDTLPTQESVKHGAYVWKKYNYTPGISYTNPSFKMKATSGASKLVLNNCTFDCTKITDWKTFFDGFAYNTNVKLQNSTKFYWWVDSSTTYSISGFNVISSTSCELTLTSGYTVSSSYAESGRTYTYSGTKTISEEIKIFMEYVVSDSPTAYPDGGTQDGYWYEKVADGLPLELLGCTKYAIDTFTSSTRSLSNKTNIPHSLGEKPKIIILTAVDFISTTNFDVEKIGVFNLSDVGAGGQIIFYNSNATNKRSSSSTGWGSLNDSSIAIGDNSCYYPAGQVYKLITMA